MMDPEGFQKWLDESKNWGSMHVPFSGGYPNVDFSSTLFSGTFSNGPLDSGKVTLEGLKRAKAKMNALVKQQAVIHEVESKVVGGRRNDMPEPPQDLDLERLT